MMTQISSLKSEPATSSPPSTTSSSTHSPTLVETVEGSLSWREVLAGGIAGITEHLVMFPFDTIKTRLQQEGSSYRTTSQCLKHILRNESWTSLYRGCVPTVACAFPAHGVYFACYESSKRLIHADSALGYAAAGVTSTIAHDFVSVPFDTVKQRMQVDTKHPTSLQCLRTIVRSEGVSRLFHSYPATVLMNVPHICTQWVVYEFCKSYLERKGKMEHDWSPHFLLAGFVAGGCAAVTSTPFDVVKTRVQLAESRVSAYSVVRDVMRTEGPSGFFKGAVPRIITIAPSAAIVLTTYEVLKNFLAFDESNLPH